LGNIDHAYVIVLVISYTQELGNGELYMEVYMALFVFTDGL
jgi:hypothetical protein